MHIDEDRTGPVDSESSGSTSTMPGVLSLDEADAAARSPEVVSVDRAATPPLAEDTVMQLVAWLHRVRDDHRRARQPARDQKKLI